MNAPLANNVRTIRTAEPTDAKISWQAILHRWFLPQPEVQMVTASQSKGVFLPYPLLAILITVGILLMSGVIAIQVQVSNLSTTLLLRDADHARQVDDLKREIAKEAERRELTDLKVADMR